MPMARLFYGSASSDGVRIHYYRTGEEKPPLVLLHGITDNGLCWNRTALMLEPDFDVVMIDARGHGLSDAPETGYDYEQQARDVQAVIEQLGLQPTIVMGHSMGAHTAAVLAARYPHLVKSLILEDPSWTTEEPLQEFREQWGDNIRKVVLKHQEKTEEQLIDFAQELYSTWEAGEIQMWARAKKQVRPEIARLADTPKPDWRDVAQKIRCPVLLITGEPDKGALVTQNVATEAARILKKCTIVHIPGASHNIRRDQFDPFFDAVSSFVML
jgi:N-formylmaleamate deformylase